MLRDPRALSQVTMGASPHQHPSPQQWRRGQQQWPTPGPVTGLQLPLGSWAGARVLGAGQRRGLGRASHSKPHPPSMGRQLQQPRQPGLGQTSLETDKVSRAEDDIREIVKQVSCFRSRMEIYGVRGLKEKRVDASRSRCSVMKVSGVYFS